MLDIRDIRILLKTRMYGVHSCVPDLHASYEGAVVKIYGDPCAPQRFTLLGQAKRAKLERDRLSGLPFDKLRDRRGGRGLRDREKEAQGGALRQALRQA